MDSEASNRYPNQSKRIKRAQNSNFTIPILPPELITEILSKLPVKSLLKFMSVSKSWLALISSPEFIQTHLTLSASKKEYTHHLLIVDVDLEKWNFKECPLSSLFYDSVTEAFDLDYPFDNDTDYMRIVGSCNGLIFLVHHSGYWILWNPTTRKYKKLPDFRPRWKEPSAIYGFGYDKLRDDYKLLGISYNYGVSGVEVKIYSLKSDSWTRVDDCGDILNTSGSYKEVISADSGLFANGKLYWETIIAGPNISNVRKGSNIISFDLANEKWEKMEKPSYGIGETYLCMGMLESDLCVFSDYNGTQLGAWVMNECGVKESWIKKFTIRYPNDQNLYPPPFFMPNKGEILGVFGSTFMVYNSKDDSFRFREVIKYDIYHDWAIYIESLVCPFSTGGTENTTKVKGKKHRPKQSSNK